MMHVLGAQIERNEALEKILEKVESYRKEEDVFLQLFDQSKVIGKEHLLWSYQKAENSFKNDSNRADDIEIETLLWASAEWQIKDALKTMGVKDGAEKVAIMIEKDPESFLDFMRWNQDDSILEPSKKKLKVFGIREEEISSVDSPYDLIFEKMATSIL